VTLFAPQVSELAMSDTVLYGCMLAGLAALIASFGNMVSQSAQKGGLPVVQSNAWGMFYGMVITALIALFRGHDFVFDWSPGYVISLLYLTVFGSVIAFGAYLTLLGRIGAHKAGYAMVMFPVVALVLSAIFEDLEINASVIIGTLLVLVGNVFVLNTRVRRRRNQPQAQPEVMPATARAMDLE